MTVTPEQVKTDEQIKQEHLKHLEQLALSHIGDIPQLGEPTDEQKEWIKRRMKGSAKSWEVWNAE
jgi:hypothetical protein